MPLMQQTGGTINQAFLAQEVAVFKMAIIDHVNLCHSLKEDVVKVLMPVVDGSVAVPFRTGSGSQNRSGEAGVVGRRRPGRPTAYMWHGPWPAIDNLNRLHEQVIPGRPPSYANTLTTDFLDADKDPEHVEELWQATANWPIW